jgi:hypothetical protein
MEKKFNATGWSTLKGSLKLRFTTDKHRKKVLERNGHEEVTLFDLPEEMDKEQACEWLIARRDVPQHVKQLAHMIIDQQRHAVEESVEAVEAVEAPAKKAEREPHPQLDKPRGRGRPRRSATA